MRPRFLPLCLVLGALALAPLGHATTVLHQSFANLVEKAEIIAVGTVSAIEAEWDATHERPYTFVTFTDLDVRKGETGETLTLRVLGGSAPDGRRLRLSGVPAFHLGDRFLLFVVGNERRAVPLVGLWQGAYRVVFDAEREEDVVYTHAMQPLTALPSQQRDATVVYDPMVAPLEGDALSLTAVLEAVAKEWDRE